MGYGEYSLYSQAPYYLTEFVLDDSDPKGYKQVSDPVIINADGKGIVSGTLQDCVYHDGHIYILTGAGTQSDRVQYVKILDYDIETESVIYEMTYSDRYEAQALAYDYDNDRFIVTSILSWNSSLGNVWIIENPNDGHAFDENGFCKHKDCHTVMPAIKDEEGFYQISNGGNLFWFAEFCNGYCPDACINAKLVADIDLCNREWNPIGNMLTSYNTRGTCYKGTFDGNGHLIKGFYLSPINNNSGLFGYVGAKANIGNFSLQGTIAPKISYSLSKIGSIVGNLAGTGVERLYTHIHDISSSVNFNFSSKQKEVGGIIGAISNNHVSIERCTYDGIMNVGPSDSNIGGIIGNEASKKIQVADTVFTGKILYDAQPETPEGFEKGNVISDKLALSNDKAYFIYAKTGEGYLVWDPEVGDDYPSVKQVTNYSFTSLPSNELYANQYQKKINPYSLNDCWQILQKEGQYYVYQPGLKKFLAVQDRSYIFVSSPTPLAELRANTSDEVLAEDKTMSLEGTFSLLGSGRYQMEREKMYACICTERVAPCIRNWIFNDHGGVFYLEENPNVSVADIFKKDVTSASCKSLLVRIKDAVNGYADCKVSLEDLQKAGLASAETDIIEAGSLGSALPLPISFYLSKEKTQNTNPYNLAYLISDALLGYTITEKYDKILCFYKSENPSEQISANIGDFNYRGYEWMTKFANVVDSFAIVGLQDVSFTLDQSKLPIYKGNQLSNRVSLYDGEGRTDGISFQSGSWGTICLPFNLSSSECNGLSIYRFIGVIEKLDGILELQFKKEEYITANVPYIVRNEGNTTVRLRSFDCKYLYNFDSEEVIGTIEKDENVTTAHYEGNKVKFVGTSTRKSLDFGTVSMSEEGVLFSAENKTINAMNAYFIIDGLTEGLCKSITINLDGKVTEIRDIQAPSSAMDTYDLYGRRLADPESSTIRIKDGKKTVIK